MSQLFVILTLLFVYYHHYQSFQFRYVPSSSLKLSIYHSYGLHYKDHYVKSIESTHSYFKLFSHATDMHQNSNFTEAISSLNSTNLIPTNSTSTNISRDPEKIFTTEYLVNLLYIGLIGYFIGVLIEIIVKSYFGKFVL